MRLSIAATVCLLIAACGAPTRSNVGGGAGGGDNNGNPDGGNQGNGDAGNTGNTGSTTVTGSGGSWNFTATNAVSATAASTNSPIIITSDFAGACDEVTNDATLPSGEDVVEIAPLNLSGGALAAGTYTVTNQLTGGNEAFVAYVSGSQRCSTEAVSGSVVIMDISDAGTIKGSVTATFATGSVTGNFTAPRCANQIPNTDTDAGLGTCE